MRLIIAGNLGHIGYVLNNLASVANLEVVGVYGPDSILQSCRGAGHDPQSCASFDDALALRPDLACLDGPFDQHASWARQCLHAGAHVLVEKPIALELDDLAELRAVWQDSGRHLLAMHGLRYNAAFFTARQLVAEGAIGRVRLLHAQKSYKLGERPEHFRSRTSFGGTIPWVGSHAVDWIHWFAGQPFTAVSANHSCIANRGHGELEASAACHFSLAEGISATANIDYLRPQSANSHGDDRIRVVGDAGIIEVRADQVWLDNHEQHAERAQALRQPPNMLADVIGILQGKPGLMNDDDAFTVTAACLYARESADSGRRIDIPHQA